MGALIDYMRQHIIDELHKLKITKSKSGKGLDSLNYKELKQELTVARFLITDISENR